jgi:hypothetical protein
MQINILNYFCAKLLQMKFNKSVLVAFILLVIVASFCRVAGYAPQLAMAVFAGAIIKDKRLAFVLPLISMFFSDLLYQVLFVYGYTDYGGFYEGQLTNYLVIASLTFIGFWVRRINLSRIAIGSVAAPLAYFFLSNLFVWMGGGGLGRPYTFSGLIMCYNDAVPFFRASLLNTIAFSSILFSGYYLIQKFLVDRKQLA